MTHPLHSGLCFGCGDPQLLSGSRFLFNGRHLANTFLLNAGYIQGLRSKIRMIVTLCFGLYRGLQILIYFSSQIISIYLLQYHLKWQCHIVDSCYLYAQIPPCLQLASCFYQCKLLFLPPYSNRSSLLFNHYFKYLDSFLYLCMLFSLLLKIVILVLVFYY